MPRRRAHARRPRNALCAAGLVAGLAAAGLPQAALAQDAARPAPLLAIDVFVGLQHEDNDPGSSSTSALTVLGLGYFTSTDSQRLSFTADVTAEAGGDDGLALTEQLLGLSYAVFSRQVELGIDLSYSDREIGSGALDADFEAGDLTDDVGRRRDLDAAVTLVTGRSTRFGTTTVLSFGDTVFSDGAGDSDEITYGISTVLRFTLDPRIELRVTGDWDRSELDNAAGTVETTHSLGVEGDLAIDQLWTAGVGLGVAGIETRTTGGTTSVDGVEAFFVLTREMRDGVLRFSIDRVLFTDGLRDTVLLGRSIELANGGALDGSIGFTIFDGGDVAPLASLSFAGDLTRRSTLTLAFDYEGDIDAAGDRIQRTSLSGEFRQNLTEVSSWGLEAGLASVENEAPAATDVLRTDLALSYIHALSSDWNFVARAAHEVVFEDGSAEDRTNVFSLGFERSFRVRP